MVRLLALLLPVLACLSACVTVPERAKRTSLETVVAEAGVAPQRAALVIARLEDGKIWSSGGERIDERFPPASTSKIPHLLIAIETGAVDGPEEWFEWDGQIRFLDSWNESQTLADAYRRSTVWVFQQVTPRIGVAPLQEGFAAFGYGNGETGPPEHVSRYWLEGPLAISAKEQVAFLARLARHTLPLSPRTYDLAVPVMVEAKGEGWTLYSKTGWFSSETAQDIGWYVGWLDQTGGEQPGTYVFAFNMDMVDPEADIPKRKSVVRAALESISALPGEQGG